MSETTHSPELHPKDVIATAFTDWLYSEVINSHTNNNRILDEYATFQTSISLPIDHDENTNAQKAISHMNRLEKWTDGVFASGTDDAAIANQIFGTLMGASGAFREQCFIIAPDQNHYLNLRQGSNPLGLDIPALVADRYWSTQTGSTMTASDLIEQTHAVNKLRRGVTERLFSQKSLRGIRGINRAHEQVLLRKAWVSLSADYVFFALQERDGDLPQVPMLEPKTITAAKLVYPLKGSPPYFKPDCDQ